MNAGAWATVIVVGVAAAFIITELRVLSDKLEKVIGLLHDIKTGKRK